MATIVQIPGSLSFAGKISDIILSSEDTVNFKILEGEETILEENYDPDSDGAINIRLRDLIPTLLHLNIPDTDIFEQTDACKTFSFVIDGVSSDHVVIAGGVNASVDAETFMKANWLTWQLQQKNVKYTDPEWLTYYAVEAVNVKLKAYFKDADPETITLTALEAGKLYSLNVNFQYLSGLFASRQPVYFDIWTETVSNISLSFIQRFVLIADNFEFNDLFVCENSLGGIDTFRFTGNKEEDNQFDISSALFDEDTTDYDVEYDQVFTKNTGYISSSRERAWLNEFFNSTQRYYVTTDGLKAITITDPEAKIDPSDPSSFYYEFKFALSRQTKYLNLTRTDDLPDNVEIIDPDTEVFFLAPRLLEFPVATIDNALLFPVQNPFVEEWKRLTYGALKSDILESVISLGTISDVIGSSHTHVNKADLDKLGILDNYLLIDSEKITAGDSDKLGGREAADFWHKDNSNRNDVNWTMMNGIVAGNISSEAFVSDTSGWRIGLNADGISRGEIDRFTIRESLFAKEFVINQTRAFNGNMIVANSARLEKIESTVFLNDPTHKIVLPPDIYTFPFSISMRLKIPDLSQIKTLLQLPFIKVALSDDSIRLSTSHIIHLSDIPENEFFDFTINYTSLDYARAIINKIDMTAIYLGDTESGSSNILIGNDDDSNNTVMYVQNQIVISDDFIVPGSALYDDNDSYSYSFPLSFPFSFS